MINKKGSTRMVILTKKYAIKIPSMYSLKMFLTGWLANMQENTFGRNNFNCLVPVKYSLFHSLIIIQPRIKEVNHRGLFLIEHKRLVILSEIPDIHSSDLKPENYGYDKGILKRFDYGN